MTDKKKRGIWVAAVLIFLCFIGGSIYLIKVWNYQKTVRSITYTELVIEDIENGTYTGECDVDFINAKVAVTVENGTITQIDLLEHKNERGTPAEKIIDDILQQQSIDVDAVSGATNSSKVIQKAVENALINAAESSPGNSGQQEHTHRAPRNSCPSGGLCFAQKRYK